MAKLRVMRFADGTQTAQPARLFELARFATLDQATLLMRSRDDEYAWCAGGVRGDSDTIAKLLRDREGSSIIPVCFRIDYDSSDPFCWQPGWMAELRNNRLTYFGDIPYGNLSEEHDFEPLESDPLEADAFPVERWHSAIAMIKASIERGPLRKAVLSRQISLFSSEPWNVESVIAKLLEHSSGTSVFAHTLNDRKVWLGASPEVLFHREGRQILVDSLAGTKQTILENSFTEKDRAEQALVTEFLRAALAPLCVHVNVSPITTRRADDLEHVYCQMQGVLRDDADDDDILAALHPTPAVCGTPREEAASLLDELEPMPRDLYGGVLGFSNGHRTTAIVVLRCAQISGRKARLFGGAGIVADSDSELEYSECGWKMEVMRRALLDLL